MKTPLEDWSDETKDLIVEMFRYLDVIEQSDSGTYFQPTHITSCRVMDSQRLNKVLMELRERVGLSPPTSRRDLHILNHPEDCKTCLGEGRDEKHHTCTDCKGSGSSNPNVCTLCKGTGDMNGNHEREWMKCTQCGGEGLINP